MFVIAWWLIFFAPFDIFWKLCNELPFLEFIFKLFYAIEAGHTITIYGMDLVIWNTHPIIGYKIKNSSFMCLLCGTVSGFGGYFFGDWLGLYRNPSFVISKSPALFLRDRHAASYFYRSFSLSLLYYCLINPSGRMPWIGAFEKVDARLVIVSIQIIHECVTYVSHNFDIFAVIADTFAFEVNSNPNTNHEVNHKPKDIDIVRNESIVEKTHFMNNQHGTENSVKESNVTSMKEESEVITASKLTHRKKNSQ